MAELTARAWPVCAHVCQLEFNAIKDEGAKAIAKGLRSNGVLASVVLEHNGVSNETLAEVAAAIAHVPETPRHDASAEAGGAARRAAGAGTGDEEEIEEISFDDDVHAEAEAAAEAAAEARERAEGGVGGDDGCVDAAGPWECVEDNCPTPTLSCRDLSALGVCSMKFEEVWEHGAPAGTEGVVVRQLCARSCNACGKDEL